MRAGKNLEFRMLNVELEIALAFGAAVKGAAFSDRCSSILALGFLFCRLCIERSLRGEFGREENLVKVGKGRKNANHKRLGRQPWSDDHKRCL
jgi:hypothetical protein